MSKAVILGAAESGIGAAVLAQKKGYEVFVSDFGKIKDQYIQQLDNHNIKYEQGQHTESEILDADIIIKSPGIKNNAPIIKKAFDNKIPVVSEIEFGYKFAKTGTKYVCITGSNGKTTTTELIYKILKDAGFNVGLGGNIGKSFALQIAEDDYEYYVLELSSFQLDNMYDFHANVAILLNITPDHLDRYDYQMKNYALSKLRIIQNMGADDLFIYNADDPETNRYFDIDRAWPMKIRRTSLNTILDEGASYYQNKEIVIDSKSRNIRIPVKDFKLRGAHNKHNIMSAVMAALHLGVSTDSIKKSVDNFEPLEHRIEPCGIVDGVEYINDSKGTNVDAVYYALDTVGDSVILILGGIDKGNDYSQLYEIVAKKVKHIVAMGIDNSPIHQAFDGKVTISDVKSMDECIAKCREIAQPGDTVLLSPACASFDLFTCYEQRGDMFREAVRRIKN